MPVKIPAFPSSVASTSTNAVVAIAAIAAIAAAVVVVTVVAVAVAAAAVVVSAAAVVVAAVGKTGEEEEGTATHAQKKTLVLKMQAAEGAPRTEDTVNEHSMKDTVNERSKGDTENAVGGKSKMAVNEKENVEEEAKSDESICYFWRFD